MRWILRAMREIRRAMREILRATQRFLVPTRYGIDIAAEIERGRAVAS